MRNNNVYSDNSTSSDEILINKDKPTLTTLFANKLELSKSRLAETCAASERYIGTQGGGMNQAISCLGQAGSAMLIDFNPSRVHNIQLPKDSLFVITNSCVEANKAATNQFNTRVVECRIATQLLAKSQGLDWRKIKKPIELQKSLNCSLLEMIELTETTLHKDVYTINEIILNSLTPNTSNLNVFQLYERDLHVFSEAQKVYDFKDAFMNLAVNYECLCDELDDLVDVCRQSGAYGSRLTGAGWDGCPVSLIQKDKLEDFLVLVFTNGESLNATISGSRLIRKSS
ncbi:unnamed protein product [Brachionus calyciflorus]|uniref:GHMP kinase C-terminal domain-containing protein n=1 Tax=Brachionus calyciflorus TaxID=104777 RepID=A0A814D338_9BILA|nr:unnamed protein product [Brachionus calyciflorus]